MDNKALKDKPESKPVEPANVEKSSMDEGKVKSDNVVPKPGVAQNAKTEYKLSDESQNSLSTPPQKQSLDKQKEPMLKKFKKDGPTKNIGLLLGAVLVVLGGIGSGWFLSGSSAKQPSTEPVTEVIEDDNGVSVGIPIKDGDDEFDPAEGILESGGIDGEGTHHLVREGGPTKYVYLTSTTLDLESFVGKTVLVKGETMAAQSAPWLMDVWVIKELE